MNLKVQTTISIVEESGIELEQGGSKSHNMNIRSHKNRHDLVVIDLDGKTFSIKGDDLRKGLDNALNH